MGPSGADASAWLVGLFTVSGAVIAGLIGLATARHIENKRSALDAERMVRTRIAAARLVCADLFAARRVLETSFEKDKWIFTGEPHNTAWQQNGAVIAAMLPPDDFDKVFLAFVQIADLWHVGGRFFGQEFRDDKDSPVAGRNAVAKAHDQIQDAVKVLHPIAYPDSYNEDGSAKTGAELKGENPVDADAKPSGTKADPVPRAAATDGESVNGVAAEDEPLSPPD